MSAITKTIGSQTGSEKTANQNEIFDFVQNNLASTTEYKYDEISFIQKNAKQMEDDILSQNNQNEIELVDNSDYQMKIEEK